MGTKRYPVLARVSLIGEPCDRCGKQAEKLRPFKLAETIVYRGKSIFRPWLCRKCFVHAKEQWWKEHQPCPPVGKAVQGERKSYG